MTSNKLSINNEARKREILSKKLATYAEDVEYIHDVLKSGGKLEQHQESNQEEYWLKDYVGNIISNVSSITTSIYIQKYGKKRINQIQV